jgi:hypothetical protein
MSIGIIFNLSQGYHFLGLTTNAHYFEKNRSTPPPPSFPHRRKSITPFTLVHRHSRESGNPSILYAHSPSFPRRRKSTNPSLLFIVIPAKAGIHQSFTLIHRHSREGGNPLN